MGEYLAQFKQKAVLLLGDYDSAGLARLRLLANGLAHRGYDPILVKDLPDLPEQDLTQKVATLGFLARFVVVDDTSASGHLSEVQLCRTNDWITILLREGGRGASWITAGASLTSKVIREQPYDLKEVETAIGEAIEWAEAKITELGRSFDALYPWRNP